MNFTELRESLKSLITESTPIETAEKIGSAITQVEELEKDFQSLAQSKEDLRIKYVNAIKNNSFAEKPKEKEIEIVSQAKTLEDCINEAITQK